MPMTVALAIAPKTAIAIIHDNFVITLSDNGGVEPYSGTSSELIVRHDGAMDK